MATAALASAIFGMILIVSGCSTPASTAGAVAAAVASNVVAAATQPTPQAAMTAVSSVTTSSSNSSKGILGHWVRNGNVINPDGSYGTGLLCEWKFNQNGSFQNQSRAGVVQVAFMVGKYKIVGGVLTLSVGKLQQIYDYTIKGSELILINPQTHQTVTLQRG
jgi:hypothetical protein